MSALWWETTTRRCWFPYFIHLHVFGNKTYGFWFILDYKLYFVVINTFLCNNVSFLSFPARGSNSPGVNHHPLYWHVHNKYRPIYRPICTYHFSREWHSLIVGSGPEPYQWMCRGIRLIKNSYLLRVDDTNDINDLTRDWLQYILQWIALPTPGALPFGALGRLRLPAQSGYPSKIDFSNISPMDQILKIS